MRRNKNTRFLKKLHQQAGRVHFLAQNRKQAELLNLHFGTGIAVTVVGMDTGELSVSKRTTNVRSGKPLFDFVYHGAAILPKGLRFFVEVTERMPECKALVPASREECESVLGRKIEAANIEFRPCTWETGLKEAIQSARLVFNPSLWSAPVEGALLKSVACGRAVATVQTQYGFEAELSEQIPILRLPADSRKAVGIIRGFLLENHSNEALPKYRQPNLDIFEFLKRKSGIPESP